MRVRVRVWLVAGSWLLALGSCSCSCSRSRSRFSSWFVFLRGTGSDGRTNERTNELPYYHTTISPDRTNTPVVVGSLSVPSLLSYTLLSMVWPTMRVSTTLPILMALVFALVANAAPSDSPMPESALPAQAPQRMRTIRRSVHGAAPLIRHEPHRRTPAQVRSMAERELTHVRTRYGSHARERRGSASLTNGNLDSFYYTSIQVGTPAQSLSTLLDTGSSDLWYMGASSSCSDCSGITPFQSSKSSSFESSGKTFDLTYGSGGVQGQVATDTVRVAGATLRNASLGVATKIEKTTLSSPTAGLMGLGFQALSAQGVTPFWQAVPLSDRVFTFTLTRATSSDTTQPGGTFTLGSIPSQYSNAIDWIKLDSATQHKG